MGIKDVRYVRIMSPDSILFFFTWRIAADLFQLVFFDSGSEVCGNAKPFGWAFLVGKTFGYPCIRLSDEV